MIFIIGIGIAILIAPAICVAVAWVHDNIASKAEAALVEQLGMRGITVSRYERRCRPPLAFDEPNQRLIVIRDRRDGSYWSLGRNDILDASVISGTKEVITANRRLPLERRSVEVKTVPTFIGLSLKTRLVQNPFIQIDFTRTGACADDWHALALAVMIPRT